MLRRIEATRYVTPLREGGSLPALVEADDDGLYVLKFRGAGQGRKALVAEVVAGELARALGFLVPELTLVELDPTLGRAEPDPEIQDLLLGSAGLNLGVDFLPGALPFDPAAEPDGRAGARGRARVARRARDEPGPHGAEREPALVARPAPPHRPRRRALLPPRAGARARPRPAAVRADRRARAASRTPRSVAEADARLAPQVTRGLLEEVVAKVPDVWLDGDDPDVYVEYLAERLEEPRAWVEAAEAARGR